MMKTWLGALLIAGAAWATDPNQVNVPPMEAPREPRPMDALKDDVLRSDGTGGSGSQVQGKENLYKSSLAFEVRGTLGKKKGDEWIIERSNLPPVQVDIRDETKITMNQKALKDPTLPEGTPVQVRFQVDGDDIVAVSVDGRGSSQR